MKINALRKELNSLTVLTDGGRKPAVRRSRRDGWIYATDLPSAATGEQLEEACRKLLGSGWEYAAENGWMLLRKPVSVPPVDWFDGPFGPEAECCRSLLERHPDRETGPDQRAVCILIRAGEEGAGAYEAACRKLHREWAERLRKKLKLPDVSPLFFTGGK